MYCTTNVYENSCDILIIINKIKFPNSDWIDWTYGADKLIFLVCFEISHIVGPNKNVITISCFRMIMKNAIRINNISSISIKLVVVIFLAHQHLFNVEFILFSTLIRIIICWDSQKIFPHPFSALLEISYECYLISSSFSVTFCILQENLLWSIDFSLRPPFITTCYTSHAVAVPFFLSKAFFVFAMFCRQFTISRKEFLLRLVYLNVMMRSYGARCEAMNKYIDIKPCYNTD